MHLLRLGVILFAALCAPAAPAPTPWAALPQDPGQQAAMLQRAAQLALPAEPHRRLLRLLGRWNVASTTAAGAGAAARTERGTIDGSSLLGGRYVMLHVRMQIEGGTLEAYQLFGFDTLHQLYTASWRDDHSTWSIECRGAPNALAPDRLVLHGSLTDARDPEGRAFRLELDLGDERIDVRLFDTVSGELSLRQTQQWTRA
jgi:hypothetical protein